MQCKNCGKENVEGAHFCGECGTRLDGKIACGKCGKLCDENTTFCVHCGARLDGKYVCKNCGNAHEEKFCPQCGAVSDKGKESKKRKNDGGGQSRVWGLLRNGAFLFGAVTAFIFVFMIGLKASLGGMTNRVGLFYFFGDYYDEMNLSLKELTGTVSPWYVEQTEGIGNVLGITGSCVSALTLICVITFATVAMVKYVLSWTRKTEDLSGKWSLLAIVSYLTGAALFYALNFVQATVEGENAKVRFNGSTVAAIALIGVAVATGVVCGLIKKGREGRLKGNVGVTLGSIAGLFIACAVFALTQRAGIAIEMMSMIEMDCGFLSFSAFVNSFAGATFTMSAGDLYYTVTQSVATIHIYDIIAHGLMIFVALLTAWYMYGSLRGTETGKGHGLATAIVICVFSVGTLVMSLLSLGEFERILAEVEGSLGIAIAYDGSVVTPILSVIFSAVLVAVSVVRLLAKRKNIKAQENVAEESMAESV